MFFAKTSTNVCFREKCNKFHLDLSPHAVRNCSVLVSIQEVFVGLCVTKKQGTAPAQLTGHLSPVGTGAVLPSISSKRFQLFDGSPVCEGYTRDPRGMELQLSIAYHKNYFCSPHLFYWPHPPLKSSANGSCCLGLLWSTPLGGSRDSQPLITLQCASTRGSVFV